MKTASPVFHRRVFRVLTPPVTLWLRSKMILPKAEAPTLPDHFLLISNHVTNYDPLLVAVQLRRHMYFVATEHILRQGFVSRLLIRFFDPIGRPKGGAATGAVLEIMRRLKDGQSVGLFAEGNCSWDGKTAAFPETTGKMVRASGAPLVTCRIKRGYLAAPRWAYTGRKGPVEVETVHVYQPEELKAMKPAEINRHIAEDIFTDAYAEQRKEPLRYKGKDLAKGIEHALLVCPQCRRMDTLKSRGNVFSCSCGLKGSYDEYGFLCVDGADFTGIDEWDAWQRAFIDALTDTEEGGKETVLVRDPELKLMEKEEGLTYREAARGPVRMSRHHFAVGDTVFPLSEIADMAVRLKGTVSFSLKDGRYFELMPLKKGRFYSGRKYKLLFDRFGSR